MTATTLSLVPQVAREPMIDTLRAEHWARYGRRQEPSTGERSALAAQWLALCTRLRERHAQARADAELRAAIALDSRLLRELQVARDLAEWKS